MDEQRAPDLSQMDEREALEFLTELYSLLSAEAEDLIRHDEYTMEWPQSGERLRGREKMKRAGQGGAVGGGGERGLRRWRARFGLRAHPRATRREGLQGDALLRRTVRGEGGAGAMVRADGALGDTPRSSWKAVYAKLGEYSGRHRSGTLIPSEVRKILREDRELGSPAAERGAKLGF
jgi:hypothetical protein